MTAIQIFLLIVVLLSIIIGLFNSKIRIVTVFAQQFKIYRNNRTNKLSFFDLFCFLGIPLIVSCSIVWGFGFYFSEAVTNILLTVFSIVFSVAFSILSIIASKSNSKDEVEQRVASETFTSITSLTLQLFLSLLLLIWHSFVLQKQPQFLTLLYLFTNFVLFLGIHSSLLFLMVIKRFYLICKHNDGGNEK